MKTIATQPPRLRGMKKQLRKALNAALMTVLCMAICSLSSLAQQITGSIRGTVKDEQGAVVSVAAVKATNVYTGLSRSAVVDDEGAYEVRYLPVGNYSVEISASGFKTFVQQNLELAVDQAQTLNVTLAVGAQTQTVTVSAAPPLVDTASVVLGRTVDPA